MRSFLLLLLAATTLLSCSSDKSTSNLRLSGNIQGLKKGKLYLQKLSDTTLLNLDSVLLHGSGEFELNYELEQPELLYLYLDKADGNPLNDRIALFAESGELRVETKWNAFASSAKIEGSEQHKLYEQYKGMLSEFNKKELDLVQQELQAQADNDTLVLDSLLNRRTGLVRQKYRYVLTFALAHPNSFVAPYAVLSDAPEANPILIDSILRQLPDSIRRSTYAKELEKIIGAD